MKHLKTKKAIALQQNRVLPFLVGCAFGAALLPLSSCGSDDDRDMTPPSITSKGITASPINCQVYHPGETISFRYVFEDDTELGNFNIEVHGNFDHHSHSTESNDHDHEGSECSHNHKGEEESAPGEKDGTPWVFNQDYSIPTGQVSYSAKVEIPIPADARHGDYHFMIRVTDVAGWQQLKAVAILVEE